MYRNQYDGQGPVMRFIWEIFVVIGKFARPFSLTLLVLYLVGYYFTNTPDPANWQGLWIRLYFIVSLLVSFVMGCKGAVARRRY